MKDILDELTFKEILAYSIIAERVSKKAYLDFAEGTVGELKKDKFKQLADDEEMHAVELIKIHKKEFGDDEIIFPKGKELPPHEAEVDVRTSESMIESLQLARQNELNANKIYKYLADEKPIYKDTFNHIANMEMDHYEALKTEMDFYTDGKDKQPPTERTPDATTVGKEQTFIR